MDSSENEKLMVRSDSPAGVEENLPVILSGHETPGVAEKVRRFYFSVAEIFEAWVRRSSSLHMQRAYRADVMSFVNFMEFAWPEESTKLLTAKIVDSSGRRRTPGSGTSSPRNRSTRARCTS